MGIVQKTKKLLGSLATRVLSRRRTMLLVAGVIVVTLLASLLVSIRPGNISDVHFPSIGTIRTSGLKAYWDEALTNETAEITWGQLYPGSAPNATLYLRSISNVPITLEITTANWTFSNSSNEVVYGPANSTKHMALTWNYSGSTLSPDQAIPVVLTLHAADTLDFIEYIVEKDVQQFSFDICIRALEENAR